MALVGVLVARKAVAEWVDKYIHGNESYLVQRSVKV